MRCDQENEKPLEKTSMSEWYAFRESWILLPMIFSLRDGIRDRKSNETI